MNGRADVTTLLSEEVCRSMLEQVRWSGGVRCLRCKGSRISKYAVLNKTGKPRCVFHCAPCRYQFSVTTGTLFHNSHSDLSTWFQALYLLSANAAITTADLQRRLLVPYKTTWYLMRRLRIELANEKRMVNSAIKAIIAPHDTPFLSNHGSASTLSSGLFQPESMLSIISERIDRIVNEPRKVRK